MTPPHGGIDLSQSALTLAPTLLGCTLVARGSAAIITEVEAYHQHDEASHSFGGVATPRTEVMFGPAGVLYVYFTYGMHWCANLVTGPEGSGEAVLLRAGRPIIGEELMRLRRARRRGAAPDSLRFAELANGPAKLAEALEIDGTDNGRVVVRDDVVTVGDALALPGGEPALVCDAAVAAEHGFALPLPTERLVAGPRIGITRAADLPWRFGIRGERFAKPFPPTA